MALALLTHDDQLRRVEEMIGSEFVNPGSLGEAFRAPGVVDKEGNKRLALVGDAALRYLLVKEGHARNLSREQTIKVVEARVCNANITRQGRLRGLDRYIRNNPSQGNRISDKLMATTMEAILGAVALEHGIDSPAFENAVAALGLSWTQ